MVRKIKESKLREDVNVTKIYANCYNVEVYETNYETGEGEYIDDWQEPLNSNDYNDLQELVNELHRISSVFPKDLSNYFFSEGFLCADIITNNDYRKPTKAELEYFKNNEINLCVLHVYIRLDVEVMKLHKMTEEEAKQYGVKVY